MHEDSIESLWRKVMNSSADRCPMEFAKALVARSAHAEREACAKVCETVWTRDGEGSEYARAIRLRSNAVDKPPQVGLDCRKG